MKVISITSKSPRIACYVTLGWRSLGLLVAACILPSPVAAQTESDASIETLVVTGTRMPNALGQAAKHTSVITREDIERRRDTSVLDLLRSIAGVQVTQTGGRGGVSSVFIRGAEPNFTVVLINGVKVNDPNNTRGGSFDFSTLNLAEIERIELVRGPESAIYGSDSLAGVISITTRRSALDFTASADAEIGNNGYHRSALQASGPLGLHSTISGSISNTDDGDAVAGNQFENTAGAIRLNSALTPSLSLDLSARHASSEAQSFPEDSGGSRLAVLRNLDEKEQDQTSFSGQLDWEPNTRWSAHLLASLADQNAEQRSPGIAPGLRDGVPATQSDSELERINLSAYARVELSQTFNLTSGIDYQREDGKQTGSVEFFPGFSLATDFALDRSINGLFVEASWQVAPAVRLSGAVRYDDPSSTSSETSAQLGAQYQLGSTRLFANWGEGFKLPSFFALGHALVGNPNLKPETSKNWEFGIDQSWLDDSLQVTLVAFRNRFENLIDFDFELFTNVNRNRVQTQGIELASNWQINETIAVSAHLTQLDIDVKDNVSKLRQRPNFRAGMSLDAIVHEHLTIHANWLHNGTSQDSSVPTGALELGSYNQLNLRVTYSPQQHWQLWVALDNLLDDDYEETVGFENPGIRSRLGLRYSW